jgi:CheY-like chemotaxis protein
VRKLKSVLLVDDDKASNYITRLLIEDMGVAEQIHVRLNGLEALEFLRTNVLTEPATTDLPELILLDINMPVMDGFEFLEKFQQLNVPENIRVVMLTTSMYHKDIERAKTYRITRYMHKPITEDKLTEILAEMYN